MRDVIAYLREFNMVSVIFRIVLAMITGGLVGYGRSKKERAAGFRTYMLICVGSCMAVLVALYTYSMLNTVWYSVVKEVGAKFDVLRIPAQAIQGIGFLGAGLIIKASHQQVIGLTTSTGLFAIVCLGIATGFGFYELVIMVLIVIQLVLNVFSNLEGDFKRRLRNITLNVEFDKVSDIDEISSLIKSQDASIYDIDIENTGDGAGKPASAIFILQLSRENHSHSGMLSSIAQLKCVRSVQELIS